MKSVAVFDMRDFDEAEWFEKYSQELGLTLSPCPDAPDMENIARVTEGCECVDIITSQITREMMEEFAKSGIRYITTRTIGYDHIDLEAAKEFGIHVGNAPYGPNGVADYTVMPVSYTHLDVYKRQIQEWSPFHWHKLSCLLNRRRTERYRRFPQYKGRPGY